MTEWQQRRARFDALTEAVMNIQGFGLLACSLMKNDTPKRPELPTQR
jgi:hypothetical protein